MGLELGENMTEYIVEIYSKGARKPYDVFRASLPDGEKPSFCNSRVCFNFRLSAIKIGSSKVKIRYASNGQIVGERYIDINGNSRIRWYKRPKSAGNWHPFGL